MNTTRDRYLTEAMGKCWHKEGLDGRCEKCKIDNFICSMQRYNYGFSTWEGFGKLWNWSQTQEWWGSKSPFWAGYTSYPSHGQYLIGDKFINPDRFADAVYAFLKEGKK